MFPYDIVLGMDLYDILLVLGFLFALWNYRTLADQIQLSARYQNLCIVSALGGILGGLGLAVVTQAFYNYMASGVFEVADDTGATFYGGLVGGAIAFLICYFVGSLFVLPKGEVTANFFPLTEIAAGSIAIAHAFGRLGCMFAGCCHGAVTDKWYGIPNVYLEEKTVPVQLMEAVFLLVLYCIFSHRFKKGKKGNLGLYLVLYGIWRFFIEYLRTDDRGATVISALTPSQLTSIILLLVGVGLWIWQYLLAKKRNAEA